MTTMNLTDTRFHLGLYVADLARSARFYGVLFGVEPKKHFADYARFEVEDPPLVLTLKPHTTKGGGPLNHVGIRLNDSATLVAIQRRLEEAGVPTQRQEGVECCYAKQTKFWVTDPDRVLWELYVLEEDIDHAGHDDPPSPQPADDTLGPQATWVHRLSDPFPDRIPFDDGTLDEVEFCGTLNAMVSDEENSRRFSEALRVLRPGGRLKAVGLIGDRPYHERLDLPGQASRCEYLPVEDEPLARFVRAGFHDVFYQKLHDVNCISVPGIDLRSFELVGSRPIQASQLSDQLVIYKGPFEQISTDDGLEFRRGERTYVTRTVADRLRSSPVAQQFVFFSSGQSSHPSGEAQGCCGEQTSCCEGDTKIGEASSAKLPVVQIGKSNCC